MDAIVELLNYVLALAPIFASPAIAPIIIIVSCILQFVAIHIGKRALKALSTRPARRKPMAVKVR